MQHNNFRGFDHTVQETYIWLNAIAEVMGNPHRQMAYHALRGVLFALRDRLTVDETFNFAAQLPMLVRGLFFEGYKPANKPEKYHADEFMARVSKELAHAGAANPENATRAVFTVLAQQVTGGEIDDIVDSLPRDLRRFWPDFVPGQID